MAAVATTTAVAADYAALVQQIYIAYFGRPADPIGFTNYKAQLAALNAPTTLKGLLESTSADIKALVNSFGSSAESVALYGTDTIAFVKAIYVNVLNRVADFDGLVFWAGEIDAGRLTKAAAALNIAQGAMVNTSEQGVIDAATLTNKVAAASAFTTEIDTTEELSAYSGATAASMARDMLKTVTSTTVAADFQATVVSTLAAVVVANTPVVVPPSSMTVTLTSGADASTSLAGDDTFVGTESTLSSADVLNGGAGTDTLRVANSGAAKTFSGFELSNIEIVQVTADGTGATAFDITGTTGITKVANHGSSQDLTFTGVKAIPTTGLSLSGVTGGSTTVTFEADVIAGSTDTLKVELNGAKTIANGAIGTVTANGIETIAVTTTGASSNLTSIASTSLKAMTVAGDKSLTLAGVTFTDNVNVNTLNAGGLTGTAALDVTVLGSTATLDVAVTGGAGDDRADFSSGFDTKDAFTGGAGRDTLALTQAVASAPGGTVTTVEILEVTNAGTGTISMANFAGVDTVYYAGGLGAAVTVSNAVTGITVRDNVDAVAQNVTLTLATNGTADTANFTFDKVGAADAIGTLSAAEFETVNITANDDAAVLDVGTLTIASTTLTAATKATVSGSANLTISAATNPATPVLATFDASAATGKVVVSGVNLKATGATVTLGAGNDTFTVSTAAGADTFDLTKGGTDKIVYNATAQSSSTGTDTIKGFATGDVVDISAILAAGLNASGVAEAAQFVGVKTTFGEAQGALIGSKGATTGPSAVFDSSTGILWIDNDANGTLDSNDMRIKFDGVTTLTAADLGLSASAGASVSVTATSANVTTALKTGANNSTTAFNDTITTAIANVATLTLNGAAGTDALVLSDAGAVGAMPATITNVETLTLNTTSTTANTGVAFNAAGAFKNVNGSSNSDTIVSTANLVAGGTVSLGGGADVITALAANLASTTIDLGDGDDSITSTVGGAITTTITGGAGTDILVLAAADNISGATVSGIETLNMATGTNTMTVAQYNGFTTVAASAVAGNIVAFTDAGTISAGAVAANVGVETFTLFAGTNTVTLAGAADAARVITGTTGVETFNTTTANGFNTLLTGAAGADILNITGGVAANTSITTAGSGAAAIGFTGVETLNISGASTANTLTLVSTTIGDLTNINASGVTGGGITLNLTGLKPAADTDNRTITLTGGDDVIAGTLFKGGNAAAKNLTLDFGAGNATVADIDGTNASGTMDNGLITLKAANSAGSTATITFAATTANFLTGSSTNGTVLDFSADVTAIQIRAIGSAGANVAGQVIIEAGANTSILWDVNGDGSFGVGDVKIVLTGQNYTGATATITGGNLVL